MDERPIRPAAQATLWAFAGRDPRTGAEVGEPDDEIDAFLQTQAACTPQQLLTTLGAGLVCCPCVCTDTALSCGAATGAAGCAAGRDRGAAARNGA